MGDKFMSKMHLKSTRFTCSACALFTKYKKVQKYEEKGDSRYTY